MTSEYSRTLEHLAKPFVESGIYESTDAFVGELLKGVAARKIKLYERKIRKFEAKYGSFEQFSQKIHSKAAPRQEDQWMEWESAINMLKTWQCVTSELGLSVS